MLRIAICDDDKEFLEKLNLFIKEICLQNHIDFRIDCFNDGLSLIENYEKYHLIFLDIEMPLIDGISVAESLNEKKSGDDIPYIVFVTGRDNLVFKALKSYPYSFIRKTDLEEDLANCIIKVNNKIQSGNNTITIRSSRNDIVVNVNDIIYLEKQKNYVVYHMKNQEYSVRSNIDQEYEKLKDFGFLRSHIGYVVNNEFVISISSDKIELQDNKYVPISKKFKNVREEYFKWLGDKYV